MLLSDIITMLSSITTTGTTSGDSIPFAYRAFPIGEAPVPPFICYLMDSARPEEADNIGMPITTLSIELYTDNKDFALEAAVEAVLTANEMVWSKEETWLEDERMQMTTYTTEVYINGCTE